MTIFATLERSGSAATAIGCAVVLAACAVPVQAQECAPDNAGITVPEGFCVVIVADNVSGIRHLTISPRGDVIVAAPGEGGGVFAFRDADGDGRAETRARLVDDRRAADVQLRGNFVYYGTRNEVIRVRIDLESLVATGEPETIVSGISGGRQHGIKTFTFGPDGQLFVNVGAPSNTCQVQDRQAGSEGMDPCPLLDTTAGIWLFAADRVGQSATDGRRWASGLRNTVALTVRASDGTLYGLQHGRDMLSGWGFSIEDNAEKPAEEFVRIEDGDDFGWPYCYYDPAQQRKVLNPEYGGDGTAVGRCAEMEDPLVAFPAHWAPNGISFYAGSQFPAQYHDGAFIAFHGSWNRAPLPQQGYNVVFVPFDGATPGQWSVFAGGFQELERGSRPVDVAVGPDGSLYVSADSRGRGVGGRIYRILHR